jgi:hypothetical protein
MGNSHATDAYDLSSSELDAAIREGKIYCILDEQISNALKNGLADRYFGNARKINLSEEGCGFKDEKVNKNGTYYFDPFSSRSQELNKIKDYNPNNNRVRIKDDKYELQVIEKSAEFIGTLNKFTLYIKKLVSGTPTVGQTIDGNTTAGEISKYDQDTQTATVSGVDMSAVIRFTKTTQKFKGIIVGNKLYTNTRDIMFYIQQPVKLPHGDVEITTITDLGNENYIYQVSGNYAENISKSSSRVDNDITGYWVNQCNLQTTSEITEDKKKTYRISLTKDGGGIINGLPLYKWNDSSCFPFDAIAKTHTGKKRCEDLVLGENVLVDHKGTFEPILFFSHRADHSSLYVELSLENGKKMSATPQHYIFTFNNRIKKLVFMKDIVKGDFVKYNGKRVKVADINFVNKRGIIAPMTKSGEIVIDGVQASCYGVEKFFLNAKVAVNVVDELGITIPQFITDPLIETFMKTYNVCK